MPAPILATKLYVTPPRSGIVPRPRLIDKLTEGLDRKLTLISAPAGFGKTTLVSEWIAELQQNTSKPSIPIAWLSLDEADSNPATFFTYLGAALHTVSSDVGKNLQVAIQSSAPLNESLLASLLNEIAAIPNDFVLVLDDYHVIDSEPVDQALSYLLDHLPQQMHLLITTREDPSLPLPRYRANGQMIEIRAVDLRFTPEEAGAFLNQMMHLDLSAESIAALDARTEGWITGLQLAALSMHGRSDMAGFIQAFTGSHRFVLDYLVEEVLQHEPELIRSFLLQTAILDHFCAPLCNAVTERNDGKKMLDTLERGNMFLIPLDDQRQWYRYHHLFAEVLQTHLLESQPEQIASLHSRAGRWYEQNGLRSDAIRHVLSAKDFEFAADLIELAWPLTEDKTIQPSVWLAWVKSLPDDLVKHRPVLNVDYAYGLLGSVEMEYAQERFTKAEALISNPTESIVVVDQEQFKSLPATIAVGRAYIAQAHGNIPDTVKYANQILDLAPEGDSYRRGQASMLLGMTYWASGNLKAADSIFADYTMRLRTSGNIPDAIATTVVLADIRLALGHLHDATSTLEELLQFVLARGEPISPDAADLYRELSKFYIEQGDLQAAELSLQRSKELGVKAHLPVWHYRWCIDQARLMECMGDHDGSLHFLDEAERLYIRTPLPEVHPIPAIKARIWLAQDRLDKALEWVREQGLSPDDDLSYLREFEHLTLVCVLIAQYQNDHIYGSIQLALHFLDRLLAAARAGDRTSSVIEILVLQALAHHAQGNIPPSLALLERALTLAEPQGFVRSFVCEGKSVEELLKRLDAKAASIPVKQYIRRLLSVLDHPSGIVTTVKKQSIGPQVLVDPLSDRELDVLRLLGTELSGPEIANELTVSLSTVRTHTRNIFAKLGVTNRRAANIRAEELNLK